MSTTITCPTCTQPHALTYGPLTAKPGAVYGDRWVPAGPPARVTRHDDGGPTLRYTWACVCGAEVTATAPALENVPCVHLAPEGEACRVHVRRTVPPSDVYSNARHGAACGCCGQQGVHLVRRDRADAAALPPCLRPAAPGA